MRNLTVNLKLLKKLFIINSKQAKKKKGCTDRDISSSLIELSSTFIFTLLSVAEAKPHAIAFSWVKTTTVGESLSGGQDVARGIQMSHVTSLLVCQAV